MSSKYFKTKANPNQISTGKVYKQNRNINKFTYETPYEQHIYIKQNPYAYKIVLLFIAVSLFFALSALIARIM